MSKALTVRVHFLFQKNALCPVLTLGWVPWEDCPGLEQLEEGAGGPAGVGGAWWHLLETNCISTLARD